MITGAHTSPAPLLKSSIWRHSKSKTVVCLLLGMLADLAFAGEGVGHRMVWDDNGMVMGENTGDSLPHGCSAISTDVEIVVDVGRQWARPGRVFGYNRNEWRVPACSRVSVVLHNHDQIRHMWMLHGLPHYLYYRGMFHLEAEGGRTMRGTFIAPSGNQTFLVHCDMAQHTEKGLKAQFIVGAGGQDMPNIDLPRPSMRSFLQRRLSPTSSENYADKTSNDLPYFPPACLNESSK